MDAQLDLAERHGRPAVLGAALCGLAGSLLRLPLPPLTRIGTALLVASCTAAVTAVALRPRQEQAAEAVAPLQQHRRQQAREQARLEAQLGINEALCTASPAVRDKLVVHCWGLRRRRAQGWCLRWLFTSFEVHNMRALSAKGPNLGQAALSELIRFFNRAGVAIPEGLLPPRMTPESSWEQLRAAAQHIWQHWEYQRFKYCLKAIDREGLICQAALQMPHLMGPVARLQTTTSRQMEELGTTLLYNDDGMRDISYAAALPPLDREFVVSGGMEHTLDRIRALIPRMLAAEGRRLDGQARRRYDRQEGHDGPPPTAIKIDTYLVPNFLPGLA